MPVQEISERSEMDQHLAALLTNSAAVRAVAEAVECTLGPKGLDCMLVDELGSLLVTNDGVTILRNMDITHPAAKILIGAAEHQEAQVGDGTTTVTVLASALITEAVNQAVKGVPVVKLIEGIQAGVAKALEYLSTAAIRLDDLYSNILDDVARVAGRGYDDLSRMITQAARLLGPAKLSDPGFFLANQVITLEGSFSQLIRGTIIDREPLNQSMPRQITGAKIIILDDALEVPRFEQAIGTESGFQRELEYQAELNENVRKLADLGVSAIFTDRAISDQVEDLLTDLGVMAVQRVSRNEWYRLAELTGARPIKRSSLFRPPAELTGVIGYAGEIFVDEKFKQIRVLGTNEQSFITLIAGGPTPEIVSEKERIIKDASSAVQAAWTGGVVPGGGSVELAIARRLSQFQLRGMANYGFQCVIEALKRPMTQICLNAGFNPLEKIEEVLAHTGSFDTYAYGVNCDTGAVEDVTAAGIWDPYAVKYHAIKTAGEVCESILRITTIIKMKSLGES